MPATFDPHDELGVPGHASEREIKAAYRRLAAQWHPDRNANPRAAERMARINQAYRHLSDNGYSPREATAAPARSATRSPPRPPPPSKQKQPPPAAPPQEDGDAPPRANRAWWNRDWGKARWEADGAATPRTLRHAASIRLEEAAFGCTHRVAGSVADLCAECQGTGRLVSHRSDCQVCSGQGRLKPAGSSRWQACTICHGDGADRKPCDTCDATGQAPEARRYQFDVRIPAGIRHGQTVMLRGQGQRGADAAGDIELAIELKPHPVFSFDAQHRLGCEIPVDLFSALAGSPVEVPMLEGGTHGIALADGETQVLEGRGFPNRDGSRGPLVVTMRTVTPSQFSRAQSKLLRQLADELRDGQHAHSPELAAWQQRLRDWQTASARAAA